MSGMNGIEGKRTNSLCESHNMMIAEEFVCTVSFA